MANQDHDQTPSSPQSEKKKAKEERLTEALRENLRRRKSAAKARKKD